MGSQRSNQRSTNRLKAAHGPWVTAGLFVGALVLYGRWGQTSLYNLDAHVLLLSAQSHSVHPHHLLYYPLLHATHGVLGWLELGCHREATWCSALLTALGVAFIHRATLRLLDRASALFATVLVACCPAVAFFATVAEVHGPFFCFAGLACWVVSRFSTRPSIPSALGAGIATGLSHAAHATGALLPLALLPVVAMQWRCTADGLARRAFRSGVLIWLTTHSVLVLAMHPVAVALGWLEADRSSAIDLLLSNGVPPLGDLGRSIGYESILPYLPLCLTAGFASFHGSRTRGHSIDRSRWIAAWVLTGAWAAYQATAYLLLQPHLSSGQSEHGAYLLPLAWPAAWLTAQGIRSPLARGTLLGISLVVAGLRIHAADQPERTRAWAESVRELAGSSRPMLMLGNYDEVEGLLVHLTEFDPIEDMVWFTRDVDLWLAHPEAVTGLGRLLEQREILVSAGTESFFNDPRMIARQPELSTVWHALRTTFHLEPLTHGAFEGYRLRLRSVNSSPR